MPPVTRRKLPGGPAALIFLILSVMPLPAKEKKSRKPFREHEFHLFIEPEVCYHHGEQDEYVFYDKTSNSEGLLSKLEWQERNIRFYGGRVGASFDRLGAEFQILSAIRGASGEMYDSDWLNYDNMKTHYSVNNNELDSCFRLSFTAYFDFHPIHSFEGFSLAPTAEFAYKNILFSSTNIEGWYGMPDKDGNFSAWNSPAAVHFPNKHAILLGVDYEKIVFYTFIGGQAKLNLLNDRLHLALGGAVSPYSYVKAEDKHYSNRDRTNYEYYNDFINIVFKTFKGNFSTFFDINDIISLGLNGEGLMSLTSKGILNKLEPGKGWRSYDGNWSGVSEYGLQIGAGIRINIF